MVTVPPKKEVPKITNRKFSQEDRLFLKACELAGVEPTRRQASKFRNKNGSAYAQKARAQSTLGQMAATGTEVKQ